MYFTFNNMVQFNKRMKNGWIRDIKKYIIFSKQQSSITGKDKEKGRP